jgi:RNA polymerase-binding transcription factor DksA
MNANAKTHLIEIPVGGKGGEIWNRLHSEREDICEVMLRDCKCTSEATGEASRPPELTTPNWHRELLQARLRKIDAALDRLIAGSYGHCSKCNGWIGDTKLEFDPAIAFCGGCWKQDQNETRPISLVQDSSNVEDSNEKAEPSQSELLLEGLQPSDTILVRTLNSNYRIFLLDPKTGRALVEGGQYLIEPREAFLSGSTLHGSQCKLGSIAVGYHLEMLVDGKNMRTSRVESVNVEHLDVESQEAITAAMQCS